MDILSQFSPDLLAGLAACAAFATVFWVGNSLVSRDEISGRIKALEERRQALRAGLNSNKRRKRDKAAGSIGLMRQVVNRLQLMRTQQTDKMSTKMMRAGWRSRDAMVIYFFCKLCLPILSGIAAILLFYVFGGDKMAASKKAFYAIGLILASSYAPDIIVRNVSDRRRSKLQDGLPDALDLMVICAEAGLSMDAAMVRVSREIGHAYPELGEEFGLTSIELGFLPERGQALENLAMRVDLPGIRGLVNTLIQSERYGTPLAQSLRVLSQEFRGERLMKAEEKAARLPALLTLPMIIFILPPLFIVLLGPAILKTLTVISTMN